MSNIGHCTLAQAGGSSRRRRQGRAPKGVLLPRKFLDFRYQHGELLCILGGIIYRLAACFARKNGAFGLPKLKLTAACAYAEIGPWP